MNETDYTETNYTDDRFVTVSDILAHFEDFASPNEEAWVDYLFKREFVWFEQETQTFVLSIKWPEMDGMDQFKMLFDFEKTLETDGES